MFPLTGEGKVALVLRATGQRFERWPVDAREMLATGDYALAEPVNAESAPATPATASAPAAVPAPTPLPAEIAEGVPAVYSRAGDALPVTPFAVPETRTPRKRGG